MLPKHKTSGMALIYSNKKFHQGICFQAFYFSSTRVSDFLRHLQDENGLILCVCMKESIFKGYIKYA